MIGAFRGVSPLPHEAPPAALVLPTGTTGVIDVDPIGEGVFDISNCETWTGADDDPGIPGDLGWTQFPGEDPDYMDEWKIESNQLTAVPPFVVITDSSSYIVSQPALSVPITSRSFFFEITIGNIDLTPVRFIDMQLRFGAPGGPLLQTNCMSLQIFLDQDGGSPVPFPIANLVYNSPDLSTVIGAGPLPAADPGDVVRVERAPDGGVTFFHNAASFYGPFYPEEAKPLTTAVEPTFGIDIVTTGLVTGDFAIDGICFGAAVP